MAPLAMVLSTCMVVLAEAHVRVLRHESGATVSTTFERDSHACGHDALLASDKAHAVSVSGSQAYQHGGRRLQGTTFSPIRITPIYINLTQGAGMSPALATFITNQLMPAAIAKWSAALSVQPVVGNLFASRFCNSYWQTTPAKCAAYSSAASTCGGTSDVTVAFNSTFLGPDAYYPSSPSAAATTMPAGSGLANADFGVFVTAQFVGTCVSSTGGNSSTLAYALSCQRDQYDRPTWGRINFCPYKLSTVPADFSKQLGTAVHELGHALGFSASSWPLFRGKDAARTPLTPRDAAYPSQPAAAYNFAYTCNSVSTSTWVPSNSTVQFFSERGMTCTGPSAASTNCVMKLVTPSVKAVAQWYLGCNSVQGAELENQDTSSCPIIGSHWEQRLFNTELMAPFSMHAALLTPLTLAVMDDSGWYSVDYAAADGMRAQSDWGFQQGCAFALQTCLSSTSAGIVSTGTPAHFGNASAAYVCTTDRRALGSVSLATYSSALPSQYQYFPSATTGGLFNVLDYCPFKQAFSNALCSDSANAPGNVYNGGLFGPGAACIESTLLWSAYSGGTLGAMCYMTSCNSASSVTITVGRSASGQSNTSITCTAANIGARSTVAGFNGVVICPDPASLCGSLQFYSTATASPAASATGTATASSTGTGSAVPSPTGSTSVTVVSSQTATASSTASSTGTSSSSGSSVSTSSATASATRTSTRSLSSTPSSTATATASSSQSTTATSTSTQSVTSTMTATPTGTLSFGASPSTTNTATMSASVSSTATATASSTSSMTATVSASTTATSTTSASSSSSLAPSASFSVSASATMSSPRAGTASVSAAASGSGSNATSSASTSAASSAVTSAASPTVSTSTNSSAAPVASASASATMIVSSTAAVSSVASASVLLSPSASATRSSQVTFLRWVVIVIRIRVPSGNSSSLLYSTLSVNATLQGVFTFALASALGVPPSSVLLSALTDGNGTTRNVSTTLTGRSLQSAGTSASAPGITLQSDATSMALAMSVLVTAVTDDAAASSASALLTSATSGSTAAALQTQLATPIAALASSAGISITAVTASVDASQSMISTPASNPSSSPSAPVPTPLTTSNSGASSTMSMPIIIGIGAGGGAAVLLIVGLLVRSCNGRAARLAQAHATLQRAKQQGSPHAGNILFGPPSEEGHPASARVFYTSPIPGIHPRGTDGARPVAIASGSSRGLAMKTPGGSAGAALQRAPSDRRTAAGTVVPPRAMYASDAASHAVAMQAHAAAAANGGAYAGAFVVPMPAMRALPPAEHTGQGQGHPMWTQQQGRY